MWRPGIDNATRTEVLESDRLAPIAKRAGLYLTLPSPMRRGSGDLEPDAVSAKFIRVIRKTWFRVPRRARMRLLRFWRDQSWLWHASAYSPRIVLLDHWPDRPQYRYGTNGFGYCVDGHQIAIWSGAVHALPKNHVGTIIAGFLGHALFFAQRNWDSRTHGFPEAMVPDFEDFHTTPADAMATRWATRWGFDIDALFRCCYRNHRKLRRIDGAIRYCRKFVQKDSEIVVCDRRHTEDFMRWV
ncbi:MAG: hypothetical protein ACE5E5_16755, partial [Phycisphaerae bacterium]